MKIIFLFLTINSLLYSHPLPGAKPDKKTLKSIFIQRLINYIKWPRDSHRKKFTILVYDDPLLYSELKKRMEGKVVNGLDVELHEGFDVEEATSAQMVIVGSKKPEKVIPILKKVRDLPIISIGHVKGLLEMGGVINFFEKDDHLLFEINRNLPKNKDIKIHHYLYELGIPQEELVSQPEILKRYQLST